MKIRISAGFCAAMACVSTIAFAETVNDTMTRIRETSQVEIGAHLREVISEDGCAMVVGKNVKQERTKIAKKLAVKMDVPAERVPEVRGLLIDAFERGFNQMMRDGDLEVDFATSTATFKGCK